MADRELHRLVAELARTRDEDIRAILQGLEPVHRDRISSLLAEQGWPGRNDKRQGAAGDTKSLPDLGGLPAWLTPRIEAALRGSCEGTYRGAAFLLAPAAREALAAEAMRLASAGAERPLVERKKARVSPLLRRAP